MAAATLAVFSGMGSLKAAVVPELAVVVAAPVLKALVVALMLAGSGLRPTTGMEMSCRVV
jgi:hypothetical protein